MGCRENPKLVTPENLRERKQQRENHRRKGRLSRPRRPAAMMLRSPIPRHLEVASPKPLVVAVRAVFFDHVIQRIASVGDGKALRHHPLSKILPPLEADGDDPPVAVEAAPFAADGCVADLLSQCQGGFLTTPPSVARGSLARLTALWRINAMQPNAAAVQFQGIAIDH